MQTRVYQHLYDYIFDARANIDEAIKNAPSEKKDQLRKARQEAIQQFFFDEKEPLIPSYKRDQFRVALRNLQAKELEKVLYGNHSDMLMDLKSYPIPNNKQICNELIIREEKHHLFPTHAAELEKFKAYFYISKLIGDFVERNNNEKNDAVAFEHAYKLLVLFGESEDPKKWFTLFDNYLSTHNLLGKQHPLHDALVSSLPHAVTHDDIHLSDWRKIIFKTGSKAFTLFNRAVEIEKQLKGNAPKDFNDALATAKICVYKNAEQAPELAELCLLYNITEDIFNSCLEVKSKQKQTDNLPNVSIAGIEVGYPGYFFVKLPIHDPRAFILGHITNCCQSMGGHSQQCVIDGITLSNNGFYVLLKEKKKNKKQEVKFEENLSPFKKNGDINYQLFDIVGQGYAWISQQTNITIDSWENLRTDDDEVIIAFLKKFGEKVTERKYPFIRVTIGSGGKTPEALNINVFEPEKMLEEATPYGDANEQSLIYLNIFRQKAMLRKIRKEINKILKNTKFIGKNIINKENVISEVGYKKLMSLLKNSTLQSYLKCDENLARLSKIISFEAIGYVIFESDVEKQYIFADSIWDAFKKLNEQNKLTYQNIEGEIQFRSQNYPTQIALSSGLLNKNRLACLDEVFQLFSRDENNLNYLLLNAIKSANYDAVKSLLDMKVNPNGKANARNPLQFAIEENHSNLDIIKALIEAKADLSVENEDGKNLLHMACQSSCTLKKLLITAGVSLCKKDKTGQLPINDWRDWDHIEIIQALIEKKYDINAADFYGNKLLHMPQDLELVELLLAMNANVNTKGNMDNSPLHNVNRIEIAKALVEAKADLTAKNCVGHTLLHRVLIPSETMNYFLKLCPDLINIKDNLGFTPLHFVASKLNEEITSAQPGSLEPENMSHVESIMALIQAKADVNSKNNIQETPLHIAAGKIDTHAIKVLIDAKADVNMKDLLGRTPLHHSANASLKKAIDILLAAKADMNAMNNKKETPLLSMIRNFEPSYCASSIGECFKAMLEAKADIHINNETTLLHAAIESRLESTTSLLTDLLNAKLDVNAKNKNDLTPLDLAISNNSTCAVRLLLDNNAIVTQKQVVQARNQYLGKNTSPFVSSVFPVMQFYYISQNEIEWLLRQILKISSLKQSPINRQFAESITYLCKQSIREDSIFLNILKMLYNLIELEINKYNSRLFTFMCSDNPYENKGCSAVAALFQLINASDLVCFPLPFDCPVQSFQSIEKDFFEPLKIEEAVCQEMFTQP